MTEIESEDEIDLLAAELTLGLLDSQDRRAATAGIVSDSQLNIRIAHWRSRLDQLYDEIPEVIPSEAVWRRLELRLFGALSREVVVLKRKTALWRGYAAAVTAVAASVAVFALFDRPLPILPEQALPQSMFTAAIKGASGPVTATVAVDARDGIMAITPVTLAAIAGRDHQLWLVPGSGPPTALGLVSASASSRMTIPANLRTAIGRNAVLAISDEPTGGSPTGLPTGPIIATGKLFPI